jgi:TRAP-type C4-dicarboxylate transport system permease small subunit
MRAAYVRVMDKLYYLCVAIAVVSVVIMTVLISVGVFTRYVLEMGAFYSEPISIFLAIQLSFYGAAACYRANAHLRLDMFVKLLPAGLRRLPEYGVHFLMAAISLFMVAYGVRLVETTFFQSYPEFQYIRVGLVYTAIPGAGLITLLFVLEKALIAPESEAEDGGQEAEDQAAGQA